jgi:hypothetical protein
MPEVGTLGVDIRAEDILPLVPRQGHAFLDTMVHPAEGMAAEDAEHARPAGAQGRQQQDPCDAKDISATIQA